MTRLTDAELVAITTGGRPVRPRDWGAVNSLIRSGRKILDEMPEAEAAIAAAVRKDRPVMKRVTVTFDLHPDGSCGEFLMSCDSPFTPSQDQAMLSGLAAYAQSRLKPPEPPVSEPSPKPREVRREFADVDSDRIVIRHDGALFFIKNLDWGRDAEVVIDPKSAPELARLILEVHEEATRPEPPKCPWCGSEQIGFGIVDGKPGQRKFCSDCCASGPIRPTEAEALAAFTGLRKGEG